MENRKILVVAAHPDDEVLGCGGTLLRHASSGDTVSALIVAEGITSRLSVDDAKQLGELRKASNKSADILGLSEITYLGYPDNKLDSITFLDIVQSIESYVHKIKPDIIYTHFDNDLNIDHKITSNAVLTACRPINKCSVKFIYAFETLSSTEWYNTSSQNFRPNHFVNISKHLESKINALKAYDIEMRAFPHPRSYKSVKALAEFRGSIVGYNAAEAFMVIRSQY